MEFLSLRCKRLSWRNIPSGEQGQMAVFAGSDEDNLTDIFNLITVKSALNLVNLYWAAKTTEYRVLFIGSFFIFDNTRRTNPILTSYFLFQMNPLESAKLDLVVAYAINSMFWSKFFLKLLFQLLNKSLPLLTKLKRNTAFSQKKNSIMGQYYQKGLVEQD